MRDGLLRLMRVVVTIPYTAQPTTQYPNGEPRIILTPLFAFFDLSENEAPPATVRYGLPKKLQPIRGRVQSVGSESALVRSLLKATAWRRACGEGGTLRT